jgi:hypothetical protein
MSQVAIASSNSIASKRNRLAVDQREIAEMKIAVAATNLRLHAAAKQKRLYLIEGLCQSRAEHSGPPRPRTSRSR